MPFSRLEGAQVILHLLIWLSRPSPLRRMTVPLRGAKEKSLYQSPLQRPDLTSALKLICMRQFDAKGAVNSVIRPAQATADSQHTPRLCFTDPLGLKPWASHTRVGYFILPFTYSVSRLHSPFLVLKSPHRAAPPTSLPPRAHFFGPSQAPTFSFFSHCFLSLNFRRSYFTSFQFFPRPVQALFPRSPLSS